MKIKADNTNWLSWSQCRPMTRGVILYSLFNQETGAPVYRDGRRGHVTEYIKLAPILVVPYEKD